MEKISFTTKSLLDNTEIVGPVPLDDKYLLLSHFVGQYRFSDLSEIIANLQSLEKGEKTFDEIHNPNGYWTFGYNAGYLEADKTTAYFNAWSDYYQSFEMPLKELITILIDWRQFLINFREKEH